jgi:hypothetical protein
MITLAETLASPRWVAEECVSWQSVGVAGEQGVGEQILEEWR